MSPTAPMLLPVVLCALTAAAACTQPTKTALFEDAGLDAVVQDDILSPSDTDDASHMDGEESADTPELPQGPTTPIFELESTLDGLEGFYDLPYPSDLRLTPEGTPDLSGFPNPLGLPLVGDMITTAMQRPGFPTTASGWFRFSAPIAPRSLDEVLPAIPASPVLLIDLEPEPPARGRLYPTVAQSLTPDPRVPTNVLAVAGRPGFVLTPGRRYAFVVLTTLGDADGEPLEPHPMMKALAEGQTQPGTPAHRAAELYQPLWPVLAELGIGVDQVAVATVFTPGDVVAQLHDLAQAVHERWSDRQIEGLALTSTDNERFCLLEGQITLPQFQQGQPPFNTEGLFDHPGDMGTVPTPQREETIPVAITVPRRSMPQQGYGLTVYYHGSGGLSTQVVDRGPVLEPDGPQRPGRGPAYVLGAHGFATAGVAMPINPQRVPGADGRTYINPLNLKAYRDTIRQGVLEQSLVLTALLGLEMTPELLEGCQGPSLPEGAQVYRFDPQALMVMGQSQGAIYANMVGALDPRVKAIVPTGSGGFWSHQLLLNQTVDLAPVVQRLLGVEGELTWAHPALQLLQTSWEVVEPVVFMPRATVRPLPGHSPRSVYQPVGEGDSFYPTPIFDTLALAYGHQQAGEIVWPQMQQALALDGLDGILDYPVAENRIGAQGVPYTSVVVQYRGDGLADPHAIFAQLDEVKHQYGCFLETLKETGRAVVVPPGALGSPCE